MKNQKLQSLKDELFSSDELKSSELKELVEIIGGTRPATGKSDDCSTTTKDLTGNQSDASKYSSDSNGTEDTTRTADGCNALATSNLIKSVDTYNSSSNGVASGDIMGE